MIVHTRLLSRKSTVRHPVALSRVDLARVGFLLAWLGSGKVRPERTTRRNVLSKKALCRRGSGGPRAGGGTFARGAGIGKGRSRGLRCRLGMTVVIHRSRRSRRCNNGQNILRPAAEMRYHK